MTVQTPSPQSVVAALEELTAARLRGDKPDKLLELSEAAVDRATAAGDLELIAVELDSAAAAHPEQGDGRRLRLAATRAHRLASQAPARASSPPPAPEPDSVHAAANATFWVAVAIVVLVLTSLVLLAALGESAVIPIAYILLFLLPLGLLFVGLVAGVGFVRWLQERRGD